MLRKLERNRMGKKALSLYLYKNLRPEQEDWDGLRDRSPILPGCVSPK